MLIPAACYALAAVGGSALLAKKLHKPKLLKDGEEPLIGFRGPILHFIADPVKCPDPKESYLFIEDGILVTQGGKVVACESKAVIENTFGRKLSQVKDCRPHLICPGFCDGHVHFPQIDMIGSYGEQLLDWLKMYVYKAEARYGNKQFASKAAEDFVTQLLRSGTTTALTFCSVHEESVEALFESAEKRDMLMIAGKVMMDRAPYAPPELRTDAYKSYAQSKQLIEKWHGRGRCLYAVTPRFAPTSTQLELNFAGQLLREYPSVYMHTHMDENEDEIALAKRLHDDAPTYLDIYDRAGLTGPRSVFAHCVHIEDCELKRMSETQSVCTFCPTSNLFLGSGLMDLKRMRDFGVRHGLGTDIGAGTSFCQLQTLNEAYKVCQLQKLSLAPMQSLYLATLGTASALSLDHRIGNFLPGKEADFVLMDFNSSPLMQRRMEQCETLEEKIFVFITLGDERVISETFIKGKSQYKRSK